jgi:hypothetical protein
VSFTGPFVAVNPLAKRDWKLRDAGDFFMLAEKLIKELGGGTI